jgi:membrane fusion protein, heavy metal efflux system
VVAAGGATEFRRPLRPVWSLVLTKNLIMRLYRRLRLREVFVVALGTALLLAGCTQARQDSTKTTDKDQPGDGPVRYVKVVEQTLPETLDLAAKVQPDPTKVVRIFPPASGRVIAIDVKPGDRVRRGQPVASLSSSDVASARSDFAKANIEAERATRAMERQKVLFEHGAAAEKDYIDARAQADAAHAEVARARQRLDLLSVDPSATTDHVRLTAPDSGVVMDVSAAPGEFSKSLESASPLITVADLGTVWVVGDVYERDVAKIGPGKPVTVTLQAYPGQQWSGRIDSLSGALDPTTRTLKARVVLPNPDQRLKPEMYGTIHVKAGAHQALVVPATAIIREGNAVTVFVKNAGKPEQRTVTIEPTVDGNVEILTGLRAGDEVAADGAELLKGGPTE